MPRLDLYQSQVNLPPTAGLQPSSPGLASNAAAISGLSTLTSGLTSALQQVSGQEAHARYIQAQHDAASAAQLLLMNVAQRVADKEDELRLSLLEGEPDEQGNVRPAKNPLDATKEYREFINEELIRAEQEARTYGPEVQYYLTTHLRPLILGEKYRQFATDMIAAQKDANIAKGLNLVDGFTREALRAQSDKDAERLLAQGYAQLRLLVSSGLDPKLAASMAQKDREAVFTGRLRQFVTNEADLWLRYSAGQPITEAEWNGSHLSHVTTDPRYQPYLSNPDVLKMLDTAAAETLSAKRARDDAKRLADERAEKETHLRTANAMMGALISPDPNKRLAPSIARQQLNDPQVQANLGSHFHTVLTLVQALEKDSRHIVTDQSVYTDLLTRIYTHDLTDPLDIIRERGALDDNAFHHALSTLNQVREKDEKASADAFRRGNEFIDDVLQGVSIYGGAQNRQVIASVKTQYVRWYDEQRRYGRLDKVDVYGYGSKLALDALRATGPHIIEELTKMRQTQKYQTPRDAIAALQRREITPRQLDDYLAFLDYLDNAERILKLEAIKKEAAGNPTPSSPKKNPDVLEEQRKEHERGAP